MIHPAGAPLVVGAHRFGSDRPAVMGIINRTDDSFYSGARQLDDNAAHQAVRVAVDEGADILDIGGVKAGPGRAIGVDEEIRRVVPFVEWLSSEFPQVVISVDTWRADVADRACEAGARMVNDTWAGHDPHLVDVAATHGAAVVCSHTGGAAPRTRPHRVQYGSSFDAVVDDVLATLSDGAERALAAGIPAERIIVDPTHDFGKNTWHSLALVRETPQIVALGYPVLMALSRKDFIGETLDLLPEERLEGTLAATAIAAWSGAVIFRTHDVKSTRRVLDMTASLRGQRVPARAVRGLA